MANEFGITGAKFSLVKGNQSIAKVTRLRADVAASPVKQVSDSVTLSTEGYNTLDRPEGNTVGGARFKNLSTTDAIIVGTVDLPEYGGGFKPFLELPPGAELPVYLAEDINLAAMAKSGTPVLDYQLVNR